MKLACNTDIALVIELAGVDVGILCFDSEYVLGILLIGDADVNIRNNLTHAFPCLLSCPELLAIVEVTAYRYALFVSGFDRIKADFWKLPSESRSDTGEVEPLGSFKNLVPVEPSLFAREIAL